MSQTRPDETNHCRSAVHQVPSAPAMRERRVPAKYAYVTNYQRCRSMENWLLAAAPCGGMFYCKTFRHRAGGGGGV